MLVIELRIKNGAQNLLQTGLRRAEKTTVQKQLDKSNRTIDQIRQRIATLSGDCITRHGSDIPTTGAPPGPCFFCLPRRPAAPPPPSLSPETHDLTDPATAIGLTRDEILERIRFLREKITIEQRLKSGAEGMALAYGSQGRGSSPSLLGSSSSAHLAPGSSSHSHHSSSPSSTSLSRVSSSPSSSLPLTSGGSPGSTSNLLASGSNGHLNAGNGTGSGHSSSPSSASFPAYDAGADPMMSQVFNLLIDYTAKISLLRMAVHRYCNALKIAPDDEKALDDLLATLPQSDNAATKAKQRGHLTGRFRIKFMSARDLAQPHRRPETRIVVRCDHDNRAKTAFKPAKGSVWTWNEEIDLQLQGTRDIQLLVYDRTTLVGVHFLDIAKLLGTSRFALTSGQDEVHSLAIEPRGELDISMNFVDSRQQGNFRRRGAVKLTRKPMEMIRVFGLKSTVEISAQLQKEMTTVRRKERGSTAGPGALGQGTAMGGPSAASGFSSLTAPSSPSVTPMPYHQQQAAKPGPASSGGTAAAIHDPAASTPRLHVDTGVPAAATAKPPAGGPSATSEAAAAEMAGRVSPTIAAPRAGGGGGGAGPGSAASSPMALSPPPSQLQAVVPAAASSPTAGPAAAAAPPASRMTSINDFNLVRVLGKGNFGKVMLAEEKVSGRFYAIKVLKKEFVLENDELESVQAEKRVFQTANRLNHPFLVKMHSCFQNEDRLFFVMEYISGGDLMMHIQRQVFDPTRARLYGAQVLLALEYLHHNNIIYRDLKLDNLLLDLEGHVMVADYGLCKENMFFESTTNTFCGTPEFMAPEILLEKDYGRAVDWWAFGVLMYEMILAQSPFRGEAEEEIFESILTGKVYFPSHMDTHAIRLIESDRDRSPGRDGGASDDEAAPPPQKPDYGLSGLLAAASNLNEKGVALKYAEPLEAARPGPSDPQWRLAILPEGASSPTMMRLGDRSALLVGRDLNAADLPVNHPSVSGQHAVVQFRKRTLTGSVSGTVATQILPYLIDLQSTNGTLLNGEKIVPRRFVELRHRDVIKFGLEDTCFIVLCESNVSN
ncbi:AGC/PKC protein kinase [Fonticula alba]|uniref:AGC/PKC protein kinase n=1 Tax=Fonticula alba TaxID=691883 RepID=A0A058Z681_FONAL|nr:AGC/PKC protein kinase [Fonticula alba]KCV69626.1 AGC/PKC protein kinase [Fonticula alba]|eukprot:XP_009496191.1 AGC/PKC protein kinase [Fonticula alba]